MYGRQRLFGCFGTIACTVIISHFLEKDQKNINPYDSLYWSVGLSEIVFVVFAMVLIPADKPKLTLDIEKGKNDIVAVDVRNTAPTSRWIKIKNGFKHVGQLLVNYSYLFMLLASLLNGVCRSIGSHFVSNFYEDKVDGLSMSKELQGYIYNGGMRYHLNNLIIGNLFEIFSFYISKPLLEQFDSFALLTAAQITTIIT